MKYTLIAPILTTIGGLCLVIFKLNPNEKILSGLIILYVIILLALVILFISIDHKERKSTKTTRKPDADEFATLIWLKDFRNAIGTIFSTISNPISGNSDVVTLQIQINSMNQPIQRSHLNNIESELTILIKNTEDELHETENLKVKNQRKILTITEHLNSIVKIRNKVRNENRFYRTWIFKLGIHTSNSNLKSSVHSYLKEVDNNIDIIARRVSELRR